MRTKSTSFIVEAMERLVTAFPEVRAKYQFDKSSITHFIEIHPKEQFETNQKLIEAQVEITKQFIGQFSTESICWLSDDDLITLDHHDIEFVGALFTEGFVVNYPVFENFDVQIPVVQELHNWLNKIDLNTFSFDTIISSSLQFNPEWAYLNPVINNELFHFKNFGSFYLNQNVTPLSAIYSGLIFDPQQNEPGGLAGESSYAQAA